MTHSRPGDMPHGIPMLARGKHRGPAEGSCLMEYVSVLAGSRFTDRPRCAHPLLSWLARRVNDSVSDSARPQLARLAPGLIGTRVDDRGARGVVRAVVYGELAAMGLAAAPKDPWLRELDELATAYLGRRPLPPGAPGPGRSASRVSRRRWQTLATFDRNFTFGVACQALGRLEPEQGDRLLSAALAASVARSRRHLGLCEAAVPVLPTTQGAPARD